MTPEELLNYKKVNYFFMPNFHDVMNNTWWVCRKDRNDDKNQNYCCNQKAFFGLYLTRCLIKLLQFFFFRIVLTIKYEKKSLWGWKHLPYEKDWKTNKLSFRCIVLSQDWLWNHLQHLKPGYWPKRLNLMQNNLFTSK